MTALDRIDFEIIALLQNDGRLANKQLARQIGLAPSSCLTRVRRLIDSGVIRGFHADIDPSALGIGLEALLAVQLERHHREDVDSFIAYAMTLPEVASVMHIAGPTDVLVHVAVRDGAHLRDLAMDAFTTRPEVARFETSLLYDCKSKAMVPVS
ncbi:MAG: Lrp/AsnC family transcriptional regulator [Actinobacteria bacterium]|nr:Lrp/AsnC family transcriptional regulator [Actinomycetota bacterium]